MITETQEGRPLKSGEWRTTEVALRDARLMVSRTANRLVEIYNCLLPSSDPKRWTPVQKTTVDLFRHHFKSAKAMDALQVQQAYRLILGALNAWQQTSFWVINNAVARRESEGDIYAYVRGDVPSIYLAECFFSEPPPGQVAPARGTPRLLTAAQRARILIHETAHCKLGVGHRGGNFGFEYVNCAIGHKIQSFEQAYDNAYVYDLLAYCASQ